MMMSYPIVLAGRAIATAIARVVPAIHVWLGPAREERGKPWMPATSAGMTSQQLMPLI
jgi:hypothetical protein